MHWSCVESQGQFLSLPRWPVAQMDLAGSWGQVSWLTISLLFSSIQLFIASQWICDRKIKQICFTYIYVICLPSLLQDENSQFLINTKYVHIKSTTVYAPCRNWDSPQPLSRQRVFPSPQKQGGGGTLACGWGVGGSPNSDEGHTLWYSLYVRTLC